MAIPLPPLDNASERKKISLIYFVILTLLLVGLVPLVLTGWMLSDKSGKSSDRSKIGIRYSLYRKKPDRSRCSVNVTAILSAASRSLLNFRIIHRLLSSAKTEQKLGETLKENPDPVALIRQTGNAESLSVFRPGTISRDEVESIAADAQIARQRTPRDQPADDAFLKRRISPDVCLSGNKDGMRTRRDVIAIVSLQRHFEKYRRNEPDQRGRLWKSGLPIIFVVDQNGNTIFHPDPDFVANHNR